MRFSFLVSALCLVAFPLLGSCDEVDYELVFAEKQLTDEKLGTDGPSLLKFFRERTLTEDDKKKLATAIKELADDDFEVREKATRFLKIAGRIARPYLITALESTDLEVRHRAGIALEAINDRRELTLVMSAARVIAAKKPTGAVDVLLDYLPAASEEAVEETLLATLVKVGIVEGKAHPTLVKALEDRDPVRRAAGAFVLGNGPAEHRPGVIKLLEDKEVKVRYLAAMSLVAAGEKKSVDVFLSMLVDAPIPMAMQAQDTLFRLAGETSPLQVLSDGTDANRKQALIAWKMWWETNAEKIDLKKINLEEAELGYTLIAEYSDSGKGAGRVWECGKDGKMRWEITDVASPMDVRALPGGKILIAEAGRGVTERTKDGKVLWEVKCAPVSCQRLANGNTVVVTYNEIFEYTRDLKQVFSYRHQKGSCYSGEKLRNGNYVFMISTGEITEVDPTGKVVRTIRPDADANGCGYWASVEGLPNGNLLVGLGSTGKIAEIDLNGKTVWSCKGDQTTGGTRLRNGHVLMVGTEARNAVEFDRQGKEVWRAKTVGRPFRARRY